jgi:hypothetical protein
MRRTTLSRTLPAGLFNFRRDHSGMCLQIVTEVLRLVYTRSTSVAHPARPASRGDGQPWPSAGAAAHLTRKDRPHCPVSGPPTDRHVAWCWPLPRVLPVVSLPGMDTGGRRPLKVTTATTALAGAGGDRRRGPVLARHHGALAERRCISGRAMVIPASETPHSLQQR